MELPLPLGLELSLLLVLARRDRGLLQPLGRSDLALDLQLFPSTLALYGPVLLFQSATADCRSRPLLLGSQHFLQGLWYEGLRVWSGGAIGMRVWGLIWGSFREEGSVVVGSGSG